MLATNPPVRNLSHSALDRFWVVSRTSVPLTWHVIESAAPSGLRPRMAAVVFGAARTATPLPAVALTRRALLAGRVTDLDAVFAELAPPGFAPPGFVLAGFVVGGTVGAATGAAIGGVVTGDATPSMAALDGVLMIVNTATLAATADAVSRR